MGKTCVNATKIQQFLAGPAICDSSDLIALPFAACLKGLGGKELRRSVANSLATSFSVAAWMPRTTDYRTAERRATAKPLEKASLPYEVLRTKAGTLSRTVPWQMSSQWNYRSWFDYRRVDQPVVSSKVV